MPQTIRGDLRGDGLRVVVLVAMWNGEITRPLLEGALDVLTSAGVADGDIVVVEVPGAFELPEAAAFVADRDDDVDAIVALGCLVRGETSHDRILADAVASGLLEVSRKAKLPVAFGLITADTMEQARARSRTDAAPGKGGHKGREAAEAAIRLADAFRRFDQEAT